jgi:hypothetical protein
VTHCAEEGKVLEAERKKGKIIKNKNKFQYKLLILMVSSVLWEERELMDSNFTASMGFKMVGGGEVPTNKPSNSLSF